jgi:hypothetical protein
MVRVLMRWAALPVATIGVAATAGPAAAQGGPNDIHFMGTRAEGGSRCQVFEPPGEGRYCPAGAATFRAHGDVLLACDYEADGHSVVVRGRYQGRRAWNTLAVNYWGADRFNGCRTNDSNYRENRFIQFKVCLADNAAPGGRRMDILGSTCGAISETFNAS